MVKVIQISWQQALPLRHKVLWPDKPPEFCYVEGDERGIHFGAYVDDALVSAASIYIQSRQARLRKFATQVSFQGQGIGTTMLKYIIQYLQEQNIEYFWCDARESALSFYERFGMHPEGERFFKSGVPYFKMVLFLDS